MQVAGAEVLVAEIVRRLRESIDATVFCLDAVGALGERLQQEHVPVISLGRSPGLDLGLVRRFASELKERKIEVIHAHQYTPFFYSACANALAGKPARVIFTEHGRHYPDVVSARRRWLNRLVFRHLADEINAVCEFSARSLASVDGFVGRPIGIVANGVEVSRYGPALDRSAVRRSLGLSPERRYILTIARFHPVKDHAMLLRALASLAPVHPDVDLLLAGDGPLKQEMTELAHALGIANRVKFLGIRRDVPELLAAGDIFALTSVSEAASLTLMEAMASGLPVVVTNVGGNPELVRDGIDGILVPRGDANAAAQAFDRLLSDSARMTTLGSNGLQRARQHFEIGNTVASYAQLYSRLAGQSTRLSPAAEAVAPKGMA